MSFNELKDRNMVYKLEKEMYDLRETLRMLIEQRFILDNPIHLLKIERWIDIVDLKIDAIVSQIEHRRKIS